MSSRVLDFTSAAAVGGSKDSADLVSATTRVTLTTLMNDMQVIAIESPAHLEFIAHMARVYATLLRAPRRGRSGLRPYESRDTPSNS